MAANRFYAGIVLLLACGAGVGQERCAHVLVGTETMRQVISDIEGYDTAAATNQSRFVADDQTQVNWSEVKKLFSFSALSTIAPDGVAEQGIPRQRDDLQVLADRLKTKMKIEADGSVARACDNVH